MLFSAASAPCDLCVDLLSQYPGCRPWQRPSPNDWLSPGLDTGAVTAADVAGDAGTRVAARSARRRHVVAVEHAERVAGHGVEVVDDDRIARLCITGRGTVVHRDRARRVRNDGGGGDRLEPAVANDRLLDRHREVRVRVRRRYGNTDVVA